MKYYFKLVIELLCSILIFLCISLSSIVAILNFRPLYYLLIKKFNLIGILGLNYEQIKENYDTLIDYNLIFSNPTLRFPYLPSSVSGLVHFSEVREIFIKIQTVLVIILVVTIIFILIKNKLYKSFNYLLFAAFPCIILPVFISFFILIGFNSLFVTFHELVFSNDYWIFDAAKDPIILFLPENFFMILSIFIVSLIFLSGIFLLLLYFKNKKARL